MGLQFDEFSIFMSPVIISLKVAIIASVVAIIVGVLLGKYFAYKKFKGMILVETFLMIPIVLPPSVIGFLLLIIFGRNSWPGQLFEVIFNESIAFSVLAAIIAAVIVAFPLMYHAAKSGFLSVDQAIEEAARVDGASNWQVFTKITIPLAKNSLVSGMILCFARAFGEFGATFMFAGNIPGKTQTIPTAIYLALTSNQMTLAWLWVLIMICISFILLFMIQLQNNKNDF